MIKKLIILTTICLAIFAPITVVKAEPPNLPPGLDVAAAHAHGHAFLYNPHTGELIELPVKQSIKGLGVGAFEASYTVDIPTAYLAATYTSKSVSQQDSSARLYLEQYFWLQTLPDGQQAMAIDYYRAKWVRLDPQVAWWDGWQRSGCLGEWVGRGGMCQQVSSKDYANGGYPISGTWYYHYPPWRGTGNYTTINDVFFQSGRINTMLQRGGGNAYNFTFCVATGGSSATTGCF